MEAPPLSASAVELHKLAVGLLTDDLNDHASKKASNFVIAVLSHDSSDERFEPRDRFVWVKAKSKVTVSLVRNAYLNQYQDQDLHIAWRMDAVTPDDEAKASDLDHFHDRIIALKAETIEDAPAAPRSSSLTSLNSPETPHAARTGTPAEQTTSRQPLQPVNRQLTREPFAWNSSPLVPQHRHTQDVNATNQPASHQSVPTYPEMPQASTYSNEPPASKQPSATPEPEESQDYKPREYDNPFASQEQEAEPVTRGEPLRQLAQDTTPERLEAGVQAGFQVLSRLQEPLERLKDSPDAQNWLEQIERVRKEAVKSRTIVGVVGNTGAGKSSVINAMLDEERLVPTNCMRACTAVVTELSYNDSKSEASRYRAEIEFIQPEDWRKELRVLFEEVFDESGHISREIGNEDSQAGVAYAKIRAVYHTHTREMLATTNPESLMRVKHVERILGTTRRINERLPEAFYRRLQGFVDSKEKGSEKLDKNGNKAANQKREFECWSLIKVVKSTPRRMPYRREQSLSICLVSQLLLQHDIPCAAFLSDDEVFLLAEDYPLTTGLGVHDSNAARAAVAEGYMKQCTGLWILAPINRAVDDKAAKTLLGNTFKRQLKYDGTYSAVSFICSKTDDISRIEAADSLQLGAKMDEIEDKLNEISKRRRDLSKQLSTAKGSRQDYAETIDQIEDQIEKWEEVEEKFDAGRTVYVPIVLAKKRKRGSSSPAGRKKRRRSTKLDSDSEEDVQALLEEEISNDANTVSSDPLTGTQIEEKLDELKTLKRGARSELGNLKDQIRELTSEITQIEEEEADLDAHQNELCIAGRNDYSQSAIRQDFAAGIKELDQENAEEEDPDNFNPEEDIRDYDEVAQSLPVFCVSSRAYQQLSGGLQKDNEVAGFATKDQTEIPQLQAHCKKLTINGRQANCRRFLNSLSQLLNSLELWSSDGGTGVKLTTQQRDAEKGFLARKLKDLEKALDKAVKDTLGDVIDSLDDQLFDKFVPAADAAVAAATPTSDSWGAPKAAGGLHWGTYRATVRRSGVFTGASGARDFNAALTEPIYKHLATVWEKMFQRRIPHILQSFTKAGTDLLKKFHAVVEARCREKGHGVSRIGLLGNQLTAYQAIFNDLSQAMVGQINESQREINREFTPVITAMMEQAYQQCSDERGTGSFKRMKGHMHQHVDTTKTNMFSAACDQVRKSLSEICEAIRGTMLDRADSVFVNMHRDYMSIIGGVNVGEVSMPREERVVRRELDESILAMDDVFQKVVESDVDALKENEVDETNVDDINVKDEQEDDFMDEEDDTMEDEIAVKEDEAAIKDEELISAEEGEQQDEQQEGAGKDDARDEATSEQNDYAANESGEDL
ncbi:hypothetical protein LTR37_001843 [Vermiconidia calcicola]|uniref:Uncharacterized protein n=1 Tax=Vermiconidia calcicola TaxID=1690605 RepID=A0ACC3NUV2_9PEZI|nr:hypothetical protein LTR37_001843 [Vermiconidia calcicola]